MRENRSDYVLLATLILFSVLSGYSAAADEVVEIPEIVISAEKVEQTSKSVSATVNVLSAEDISSGTARTFDQALESIPGMTLNRSAGTATNSMSIRGSSDMRGGGVGNRVLLLMDGRPAITADTGGANWGMLPMEVVERVEVVKGALSPLYGSNAMGGVVNFITKSPAAFRDTKLNLGWGYYEKPPEWMRYTDERNDFSDVGIVHSNSYGNLGYVFSIGGKQSDGYRQNTDFSQYNAYSKVIYSNEKEQKFGLSLSATSMERGYPYPWLIDNIDPYVHPLEIADHRTNDRQEKRVWDLDLFLKTPIGSGLKLSANLYHSNNYSKSLFNPDDIQGDNFSPGFFTDSDAGKSGALFQVDISLPRRNYLILGLDVQLDAVNSSPAELMFGNHKSRNFAGFAQDRIMLTDALAVMLGIRYDYRHPEDTDDEGQASPKLGMSYQVNDDTSVRFSIGQAFRAPSLAEIYLREEVNSGIKFIENPDLKSEKLRLYAETGVKRTFFRFVQTDTSVFIYDFSDMIFWQPVSENEYQVSNLSRSVIMGAETGLRLNWRDISASASYTYLNARDKTEGRTDDGLPYKPEHSAYADANYRYSRLKMGASIRYVSKIKEAIFYPNDAPGAFYVVNAKLSFDLSDRITLSIALNNLLDRQYEEIARYRMPGRFITFRMTADISI